MLSKPMQSPHWPRIEKMLAWFYGPDNEHTKALGKLTDSQYATAAVQVELALREDMDNAPGCVERLGAIVRWACSSDFWRVNLQSLASIRKDSGNGPKWMVIEGNMRKESASDGLDDLRGEIL